MTAPDTRAKSRSTEQAQKRGGTRVQPPPRKAKPRAEEPLEKQ
ncbi:hypothetical protein ACLESO_54905 [Pyxidicoccus sp. 3LG]